MEKVLGLVGLLYKAHKAYIGAELLAHLDKCYFVFVAKNLSSGTSLRYKKKILALDIPLDETFSMEELGAAVGKPPVSYIGIIDKKAANAILGKLKKGAI